MREIAEVGPPQLAMCPMPGWHRIDREPVEIFRASHGQELNDLVDLLLERGPSVDAIRRCLVGMDGHFAMVVSGPRFFFAAVDKTRSIPLFYRRSFPALRVGNRARDLVESRRPEDVDHDALLEMRMAGYVTGDRTVIRDLHQLLPGEFLLWTEGEPAVRLERYYRYVPTPDRDADPGSLAEELAELTDDVFEWTAEAAGGRPIWIPLSGGLDSRLVLCKLHELGYEDLRAYSYGVRGNHEARVARDVAERLGVPWEFVPLDVRASRRFFWSSDRREYWSMADGLSSVPVLQDVVALRARSERGEIPGDAIFINGQTGDYLTGGHIPGKLLAPEAGTDDVLDAILIKHFSLWKDLKSPDTLGRVREILARQLAEIRRGRNDLPEAAGLYEAWEWQERQSKYVVNSARMYDYGGFSWLMPLWHGQLMRFWEKVPYDLKFRQRLYKDYLERWDYEELFSEISSPRWPWPGGTMVVLPIATAIGKLLGRGAKEWFYRRARYFGHYKFVYGIYGLGHFLSRADSLRNPVSLMAETWVEELRAEIDSQEDR